MSRAKVRKVRDEGHWVAVVDGKPCTNQKHDTPGAALREAQWWLVDAFSLKPGEERLVADIAKELQVPRHMIESIPDDRDGYQLHGGARREWTLFRDEEPNN